MRRRTFFKTMLGVLVGVHSLRAVSAQAVPAERRVLIQRSPVAGFQYYEGPRLRGYFKPDQPLTLQREAQNSHDRRAVAVYWQGRKVGYVPRRENRVISAMMDRGERLEAKIVGLGSGDSPWQAVMFDVEVVV